MAWIISEALMRDYENSRSFPERAAESSADTCLDGEPLPQLNGPHIQLVYLPPDKMTDFSRLSRFGMMFKPLTADRGEELLTWYREVFPARTYPLPEKAQGSTASVAGYGEKWRGSLARFDPDTCSWKTVQHSLLEDSGECSVTWPRSGMTANGLCWEQPMLALRINGTGSGLWPTPTVCGNYNRKGASATSGDGLATAVRMWPTPTTRDRGTDAPARMGGPSLAVAVRRWTTPTAHNAKEGGFASEHERNTPTLAAQAGGALNPTWVEWLMGWPLGWTDLKQLETARFRRWLREHSPSYRRDSDKSA